MGLHIKTTKKEITKKARYVLAVGYCDLCNLLTWTSDFYTSGVYGWNSNIFVIDGIAICTGYRPFGLRVDHKLVETYNKKGENKTDKEKQELVKEFIIEALKVHFPNNNIIIR